MTRRRSCGPICWNASGRKCKCICGGREHGAAKGGVTAWVRKAIREYRQGKKPPLEYPDETKGGAEVVD